MELLGCNFITQNDSDFFSACDSIAKIPCLKNGREVLRTYDFDRHSLGYNMMMTLLLYFTFHMLAYMCLCFRIRHRPAQLIICNCIYYYLIIVSFFRGEGELENESKHLHMSFVVNFQKFIVISMFCPIYTVAFFVYL